MQHGCDAGELLTQAGLSPERQSLAHGFAAACARDRVAKSLRGQRLCVFIAGEHSREEQEILAALRPGHGLKSVV